MGNDRNGFIRTSKDLEQDWRALQGIPVKGTLDMYRYSFIDNHNEGKEHSKYIMLGMDKLQPGGGIDEHYNKYDAETPIFDHIYYVISGRIRATIGDTERIVGADSMIYCPSNIKHSITNIGKRPAKVLRIKGSIEGEKSGDAVFTNGQVRIDYWFPAKQTEWDIDGGKS